MGFTISTLKISNELDRIRSLRGELEDTRIRTVEIAALADTGSYMVSLPPEVIRELGLPQAGTLPALTAAGRIELRSFSMAHLELFGRRMTVEVLEGQPETPALIGVTIMELFDLIVDPRTRRLLPRDATDWAIGMLLAS